MKSVQWRWLVGFAACACLLMGAVAVGLLVWAEHEGVEALHARLAQAAPWLLLWRSGLFATLVVCWPELAGWASRTFALTPASAAALHHWRWRAAAGLLLMDLVLVEDLIGTLQSIFA